MRKDSAMWLEQAEKDFEVAKKNFKLKEWYVVAFFCQQAVEKALKALYQEKKKDVAPPTHSLVFLGREVGVPSKYIFFLKNLSTDFVATRYPDVFDEVPYKQYVKEAVKDYLKSTEEVLQWVKSKLKKQ
jgi:HEPN domain-containing protein